MQVYSCLIGPEGHAVVVWRHGAAVAVRRSHYGGERRRVFAGTPSYSWSLRDPSGTGITGGFDCATLDGALYAADRAFARLCSVDESTHNITEE